MSSRRRLAFVVNGEPRQVDVEPRTLLSDGLRHHLGLTGTHVGCEQGSCGACTVLLDRRPIRSCLVLAPQAEGATIETIEGIARAGLEGHLCRCTGYVNIRAAIRAAWERGSR
jgi:aerobic-type carbon monoxide dehydrogenase small subunit (CoxS/CutS family)